MAIILQYVYMSKHQVWTTLNIYTFVFHLQSNKAKKNPGELEFVMFWYVTVH